MGVGRSIHIYPFILLVDIFHTHFDGFWKLEYRSMGVGRSMHERRSQLISTIHDTDRSIDIALPLKDWMRMSWLSGSRNQYSDSSTIVFDV